MSKQRPTSRRRLLAALGGTGVAGLAGCLTSFSSGEETGGTNGGGGSDTDSTDGSGGSSTMTIFHAGSLQPPFSTAEPEFESEFGVQVNRETKGSVASTKKITQQGRAADVLGVSDFRLIRDRVVPEFGNWYAIFTTNAMAISYRPDSPGADEISTDNWWEVLSRDGITVGHSDPAVDPGGYRAVMTTKLGKTAFEGTRLYDDATYQQLRENMTVPTGTEVNLKSQLEARKLDYAIYYQSIAKTAESLEWVNLQPEVDLSQASASYAKHYAKATVETDSGTFTGAPIAYGVTVPGVAEAPDLGAKWVEYFVTDPGKQILREKGLQPLETAVVPEGGRDAVPERVRSHIEAKASLGPLQL